MTAPLAGLACLVLAHDNPVQLAGLLRWLSAAGAQSLVHLDSHAHGARAELAGRLPRGARLLPATLSRHVDWGGFSMVAATLALMREAVQDPAARHLLLLSGTHLPLRGPEEIATFLFDGRQHLDLRFACMEPPEREGLERFWYRGLPGREEASPLVRGLNRQAWRLGQRSLPHGLRGMTPMVGSQWWHMTSDCARHLLRFLAANPWYGAFFHSARIPDESFFHTLVGASPFAAQLGEPFSFQRMQGYSPALLGAADLPAALASGRPFGRKFDLRHDPAPVQALLGPHLAAPPERKGTPAMAANVMPDGMTWLDAPPALRGGEILALVVARNEALRLPACLRHLRRLGVDRTILVDNRSTDGTRAIAAAEPWVHVVDAPGSYAGSNFGVDWTNAVLDRHANGHWVLVVDADELLVFPGGDQVGLRPLCAHLEALGSEALRTVLLDCFPPGPLAESACQPGDELLDVAPFFEAPALRAEPAEHFPWQQEYGGLRERLFFPEADPRRPGRYLRQKLYNLGWRVPALRDAPWFRALAPKRSPNLTKVPLVKWRPGAALLSSTHMLAPMRLAAEQPSGVLLHFKFLQDFHDRAVDAITRGAHYDGSREYRRYLAALKADPNFRLHGPHSRRFEGPEQLVALGLMRDTAAWAAARSAAALQATGATAGMGMA